LKGKFAVAVEIEIHEQRWDDIESIATEKRIGYVWGEALGGV
tara:strand:- start:385 stop:510 length:126 start_codon:yes stop_codon:yes gene_type:complete